MKQHLDTSLTCLVFSIFLSVSMTAAATSPANDQANYFVTKLDTTEGNSKISSVVSRNATSAMPTVILRCQSSSTGTCFYSVRLVRKRETVGTQTNIEQDELLITLKSGEERTFQTPLDGSSVCQSSLNTPNAASCTHEVLIV